MILVLIKSSPRSELGIALMFVAEESSMGSKQLQVSLVELSRVGRTETVPGSNGVRTDFMGHVRPSPQAFRATGSASETANPMNRRRNRTYSMWRYRTSVGWEEPYFIAQALRPENTGKVSDKVILYLCR